jgi:hypothetical protein
VGKRETMDFGLLTIGFFGRGQRGKAESKKQKAEFSHKETKEGLGL